MREILLPWDSQPQESAELDETHWLYKDLLFVHTGVQGYVQGAAVAPVTSVGDSRRLSHPLGGPFSPAIGFKGTGGSYLEYQIPYVSTPVTLSTWDIVNGTDLGGSALLGIGLAGFRSGLSLSRGGDYTSEPTFGSADTNSATTVSSVGSNLPNVLKHTVGVRVSSALRYLYVDSVLAGTDTVNSVSGGDLASVLAHRGANSLQISKAISELVAMPMVINRPLSAAEVARLYAEQLKNPWSIFKPRSFHLPRSADIGPAVCLESGALVSKSFVGTDRRVYLTTAGSLVAKAAAAGAGEKLVKMVNGRLLAG